MRKRGGEAHLQRERDDRTKWLIWSIGAERPRHGLELDVRRRE